MILKVDPFSDSPSQIELRSSGGVGECRGSMLGLYQLLPDDVKGASQGPVYQQRHDGDNEQYYLYRWAIDHIEHAENKFLSNCYNVRIVSNIRAPLCRSDLLAVKC